MEFITRDYEMAHGRGPKGRGLWAFSIQRQPQPDQIFWARETYRNGGTFAQAKREARQYFKESNAFAVYVLS